MTPTIWNCDQFTTKGYRLQGTVNANHASVRVIRLFAATIEGEHDERKIPYMLAEVAAYYPVTRTAAERILGSVCDLYDPELRPQLAVFLDTLSPPQQSANAGSQGSGLLN